MTRIIFLLLLLAISSALAIRTGKEKCPFNDTVDLSNYMPYDNGSYSYQNIIIPKANVSIYEYRLEFLDTRRPVPGHPRACVCGPRHHGKYCIKLCCEPGEFYNETSLSCMEIPRYQNVPSEMTIMAEDYEQKLVNVFQKFTYQVGLPCDKPKVLSSDLDTWDILEDGTLMISNYDAHLDTVSYCLTPKWDDSLNLNVFMPMSCPMKSEVQFSTILNTYGMLLSVSFLVPTIAVHLLLKELRENLKNKILICYLLSLTVGYLIISMINITQARFDFVSCSIIGYIGYYFLMAAFVWISVLCFELWYNFKAQSYEFCTSRCLRRFKIYSMYAWGLSALMTAIVVWTQLSDYVDDLYKPGIGIKVCWLDTRKWSAALYFYGPNTIILIFSAITFVYVTMKMYRMRCDSITKIQKQSFFQENVVILVRLFLLMGITWIMDILSFCVRNYPQFDMFFVLTDFCNAIQGVLIFILFVMRRKVTSLLKAKFLGKTVKGNGDDSIQFHSTLSMSTKVT
uniref:G-protein coupled receptors family 2 profile 2 domain-containing protein n=1 Tax=Musca domestica TaxID=7370 RepID=A0A1I8NGG9_MUSDO